MNETIYITRRAARTLRDESWKCDVETGGSLSGYRRRRVVDLATGPGPKAMKRACMFSADVEYQQQALEEATRQSNGRARLVGYWHRHPGNMGHPSSGDQAQAREIADGFSKGDEACNLVAVITTVKREARKVAVHTYVFNPRSQKLEPAKTVFVSDDDPIVARAREAESCVLATRKSDLFNELGFRFHETLMGKERLRSEVEALEAHGFGVSVSKRKRDARALIVVECPNGKKLIVVPPIEYPLNPPRVFELPHGNEWLGSFCPVTLSWNSDRRIIDLLRSECHGHNGLAISA